MERIVAFQPFFGNWFADEFLGEGGCGRVYRVFRQTEQGRQYAALKWIPLPKDTTEIEHLRSEGMSGASLVGYYAKMEQTLSIEYRAMDALNNEPNVVHCLARESRKRSGGVGYDMFILMELLTPLAAIAPDGRMAETEAVRMALDIAAALEACHRKQILHRDVKPSNIFRDQQGRYRLGDFGVARHMEQTHAYVTRVGTVNYMAPELNLGQVCDSSVDLYALGLTLYQLLNRGRMPFLPPAPAPILPEAREEALMRRMSGETLPQPLDASLRLYRVIQKACAYSPLDRYRSAADFRAALLGREPLPVPPPYMHVTVPPQTTPPPYASVPAPSPEKESSTPKYLTWVLAGGGLLIGILIAILIANGSSSTRTPQNQSVWGNITMTDEPYAPSVTDAPVTNAPAADAPVTDAPRTDAPVTSAPTAQSTAASRPAYVTIGGESFSTSVSQIKLEKVQIDNLDDLAYFPNLTSIRFDSCVVLHPEKLGKLTQLTKLELLTCFITTERSWGERLSDVSFLRSLTQLTSLTISNNCITDLSPIENLANLTELNVGGNRALQEDALQYIAKLPLVTVLYLHDTSITDFRAISGMTQLTYLNIRAIDNENNDGYVRDISYLAQLPWLQTLKVSNSAITDLSCIKNFPSLTELYLDSCILMSDNAFAGLSSDTLQMLNLSGCNITKLDFLAQLPALVTLRLVDCPKLTAEQFSWLTGNEWLATVYIGDDSSLNAVDVNYLKSLLGSGVAVKIGEVP